MKSEHPQHAEPIRIRELRSGDKPQWEELWRGYLEFYKQELPAEVTRVTWNRLINADDQPYAFVAQDDTDALVGFAHYHYHLSTWSLPGYCYLEDLFVARECRGKGAGRSLIEAVYRAADKRGVTRVYWHTENTNLQAQALYDKLASQSPFIQYRRQK